MTKEQERNELHKAIWDIADELRGSVDGWDFKQYILGFLFYRFISENITEYINKQEQKIAGNESFNYSKLTDEQAELGRETTIEEKGFYILPSELFCNVVIEACRKDIKIEESNLNVKLAKIFSNIENSAVGHESEENFKGLFSDLDVNSSKLGASVPERNEKLQLILKRIDTLPLGNFKDNTIDAFGDAYEFLMGMYASQAGKSGGEYFTPQEVSELLAHLTTMDKKEVNKVYDPCCGSGSLLLKFAKVLGKENVRQGFYGQELNLTTYNLCRINMILHDIDYNKFNIKQGDTLINPKHWDDEPFDAIVSNPPYSTKWAGDSNPILINDERFSPAGVLAPKTKADLAFTMHMLHWLSNTGTCAIVEFPGVLYRGGAEQKIRKYLVDNNFVDCVIQLPADLFFGVGIATCILVLKKNKLDNKTLFIDASNEFIRVDSKNKLTEENSNKILDCYKNKNNIEYFSSLVSYDDIKNNDFNLSVSNYVEKEDTREIIDIKEINKNIQNLLVEQKLLRERVENFINNFEGKNE